MAKRTSSGQPAAALQGYVEFEFDLPGALLARLLEEFERLQAAPLNADSLQVVQEEQGVYQLFLDDELVYVGKTDADAGLRKRLSRHAKKILHRANLEPDRVSFKAIRIYVFTALDLESELIKYYGGVGTIAWNGSGFGSNDPGRERDTTRVKDGNFDAQYPIDIDRNVPFAVEKGETVSAALLRLKEVLPFTLRFETRGGNSRRPHDDLVGTQLQALSGPVSVRNALEHIVTALPVGWQATALLGYVILYKEAPKVYPQSQVVALGNASV